MTLLQISVGKGLGQTVGKRLQHDAAVVVVRILEALLAAGITIHDFRVEDAVPSAELGPAAFVHDLVASGLFAEPSGDLEKLIGHPPTSLRTAVEAVLRG